ncbi:5873_t:CDS:2 [Ambispora leptoticha]|uniref:5873_t:CDS:1 n=1 Tax=Ambispora leptoticha TaxID=144679 RepID=A0A9N9E4A3_9GLOM|nr:5873_t:CDS:2 [Ambispora leptoticha]
MKKITSIKKEQNVRWILSSPDPSPIAFFRFNFSTHRSRAFDSYDKVLETALAKCEDEDIKERLLRMQIMYSTEIQKDWELWLEERKVIKVNRSIQDTNVAVQTRFNTRVKNQGTLPTTSTIKNIEDNREPSIVNSPITTDSDDVLEAIASLFESSQEDLISTITEENLDREEMVIPSVQKQLLKGSKLMLSSQLDVFAHFRNIRLKIPSKRKILNPAYYGIIDLTGQHIRTKASFAVDDWKELRNLFGTIVQWQSIQTPENFVKYFDDNFKLPPNPEDKLKSFHTAVQFLRTSYPSQNSLSEQHAVHALYYPIINTILRDDNILLMDWGEMASSSSSNAKNDNISPERKAKIGYKVDFKITLKTPNYKLQAVHGEMSGGIRNGKAEACRRKQWLDKLKLMIMLRDELNQVIKAYNQSNDELLNFIVYGIQVIGFHLNVYAMIWCSGGVYLFGLVDKCLIPNNLETFYSFEEVYVILKTLQKKVIEASSVLIDIERNHAKKRRRLVINNQYNFDDNLVFTQTTKHQKTC